MRSRSKARARVLQVLYAWEMRDGSDSLREVDSDLEHPCRRGLTDEGMEYAYGLLDRIQDNLPEIDTRIQALSKNWRLSRMTVIDRNILRIAAAEMIYDPRIPLRVSLQEAIRLADLFATQESRRFINGVLDALLHSLELEKTPNGR